MEDRKRKGRRKDELTEVGPQVHTAEYLDSEIVIHFP
jgi:hypothetical protein